MNDSVRQLFSLAREHFDRHDYPAAETLLREVARQDVGLAEAHHLLGVIQHDRGAFEDARGSFGRALALDPGRAESALNLAITCNELGLYTEARRVTSGLNKDDRAGDRIGAYARGKLASLHADVAHAYEAFTLYAEAAAEYRKALALSPDLVALRTRLGVALRGAGDLDGAAAEFEAATAQQPRYVPAYVALGLTHFRAGRRDAAEAAWRRALEIEPAHRPAQVYLHMLRGRTPAMPSSLPPTDDELEGLEVSVLADREAAPQ